MVWAPSAFRPDAGALALNGSRGLAGLRMSARRPWKSRNCLTYIYHNALLYIGLPSTTLITDTVGVIELSWKPVHALGGPCILRQFVRCRRQMSALAGRINRAFSYFVLYNIVHIFRQGLIFGVVIRRE